MADAESIIPRFENPFNHCWFNSVLQVIFHALRNAEEVLNAVANILNFVTPLFKVLIIFSKPKTHNVGIEIEHPESGTKIPLKHLMLEKMGITSQEELEAQQDASECIEAIIGDIPELSFLLHQTHDHITCAGCGHNHIIENPKIPVTSIAITNSKRNIDEEEKFSARDAIKRHFQDQEDEVERNCDKCHHTICSKEIKLIGQPNYIIIQLKRFSVIKTRDGTVPQKIVNESEPFSFVDINTSQGTKRYEVIATIEHTGKDSKHGHYISYILNKGTWFLCNDTEINPLAKNDKTPTKKSYILLLKKAIEQREVDLQ